MLIFAHEYLNSISKLTAAACFRNGSGSVMYGNKPKTYASNLI